jgi:hypothetical protein
MVFFFFFFFYFFFLKKIQMVGGLKREREFK